MSFSMVHQGDLYEGREQSVTSYFHRSPQHVNRQGDYHCVDVVWMQLKARAPKNQGFRIYSQLKDQMSALPGFVAASWARDVDHRRKIAFFTGQEMDSGSLQFSIGEKIYLFF
ncbi:hypothetical protein QBC42DRAFT_269966 [Cladorrhinum samala]|uniref:Uncharacterized protein n=1 Tax=Cladorrhinum samala TaxID=585594 RepID=A0AAV9HPZ0_9PEZI|nr:hypothetical protein QBC42DRAFT_269966 [Cladorrhinum samala]